MQRHVRCLRWQPALVGCTHVDDPCTGLARRAPVHAVRWEPDLVSANGEVGVAQHAEALLDTSSASPPPRATRVWPQPDVLEQDVVLALDDLDRYDIGATAKERI